MPVGNPTYLDYATNADDNQAAQPIGAPEGNFKGEWVNNIQRHMMAVIRRLGDACLQLSGDVFSAASKRIANLAAATARTDAARFDQLQDSSATWAGTTTGSANSQVLTLTPALAGGYRAGQQFRCIVGGGLTNTGALVININGQGQVAVTTLAGAALVGGEWHQGYRQTIEFDGTKFRMLDSIGWMEQKLYDFLFPIGFTQIKRNQTAPVMPRGVTATWTRVSGSPYLRGTDGAPGSGGSLSTNTVGPVSTGNQVGTDVGMGDGGHTGVRNNHTHSVPAHSHTLEPTYRSYSVWERTA